MKNIKAKGIALAGIGSAISLVFVILSHFFDILSITFNALAATGMLLPLAKKHYKSALLACVAVSVLGFLIVNVSVVPFVMVGGFYTVFTAFWNNKKYSYVKSLPIKTAYSILVFFVIYHLIALISLDVQNISFLQNLNAVWLYVILNLIFSILFLLYDKLLLFFYAYLKNKIIK